MKTWYIGAAAGVVLLAGSAVAGLDTSKLKSVPAHDDEHPLQDIISGYEFRTPETQSLQDDDFSNPAFPWVDRGEEAWNSAEGSEGKSCATCHGDADDSMKGVRANMPKWNDEKGRPMTLENNVNNCRTERMGVEAWKWESDDMLGMTAFIGSKSRGMPMNVQVSGPMKPWFEKGRDIYYQRYGQLDMACAHCHEDNYGNYIRADMLSQGHINGFPTYRLKWQKPGSIHRRFKGCIGSIRGDGFKRGSDELIALEIYVAHRGQGLPIETPAVRQ